LSSLVAVSISLLTNSGIFNQAQTAASGQRENAIRDSLSMYLAQRQIYELTGVGPRPVRDDFTQNLTQGERDSIREENGELKVTVDGRDITIGRIPQGGSSGGSAVLPAGIEVGDFVNFQPNSATTHTPNSTLAGAANTAFTRENLNWQFMGQDAQGRILLISHRPTNYFLSLHGAART